MKLFQQFNKEPIRTWTEVKDRMDRDRRYLREDSIELDDSLYKGKKGNENKQHKKKRQRFSNFIKKKWIVMFFGIQ